MFKTAEDFGGYWVKNVKNFRGHEQEPLFQCSVYKDNKKIGFFSQDSWGGPAQLDCPKKEDREDLIAFAKEYEGEKAWAESYHTFIAEIVKEIDIIRIYKKACKTKLVLRPASFDRGSYLHLPLKQCEGKWETIRLREEKRLGEKVTIVNEIIKNL